ncbi:hypothetical protein DFA_05055 [Cavenderia fasciculata]|uniref:Paramecium surface antigen repeat-containing protein n=1 Tax=Cavenderia fasciculata TaxID=261658 RepID=F4PN72_CACFS|nr:uncharacterized protein DFA_05055 [Cavenderia fasciculata]EGG22925.1 hypothetical protein DFA_05055 [Cavenderia fasciculata]|eukprot:XP_004360776.1 hypothetical protein DFA_05055 [Cavenderia fasciculata]
MKSFLSLLLLLLIFITLINIATVRGDCTEYDPIQRDCVGDGMSCNASIKCNNDFFCNNGICAKASGLGQTCTEQTLCIPGLTCQKNICIRTAFVQQGSNCTYDGECFGMLQCIAGICSSMDNSCDTYISCSFGQYCKGGKCVSVTPQGGECNVDSACGMGSGCNQKKCVNYYSLGKGAQCDSKSKIDFCDYKQGLICEKASNTCGPLPPSTNPLVNCFSSGCNQLEQCFCESGKNVTQKGTCFSVMPNTVEILSQCKDDFQDYMNCMTINRCVSSPDVKYIGSCEVANCGNELCSYISSCGHYEGPVNVNPNPSCYSSIHYIYKCSRSSASSIFKSSSFGGLLSLLLFSITISLFL